MDWRNLIHKDTAAVAMDACRPGDEVRVWFKIYEQDKERTAQFEGILMRAHGAGASKTITVRRVTYGEGVERNFPLHPKVVSKIEVLRRGKVKRSRLYFLRRIIGKTRIASAEQAGGGDVSAKPGAEAVAVGPEEALTAGKPAQTEKTA